jgi:gliding motility-associated-like protein
LFDSNNNILSSSFNVNNLSPGNYSFLVNDNNECNVDNSFDILNPIEISIIANSITDVDCYGDYSGSLSVDINNNIGSSQIIWSPIEFNTNINSITNLCAGQYNIVVIDENGCTKIDSFEITQNDNISLNLDVRNSTCSNSIDGEIDLIIDGGVSPYSIFNDSYEITSNIFSSYLLDSLLSSEYNIKISDSYNCELDTLINVDFIGGYDCINEPIIISPNFDGFNDLWSPILDLDTEINVVILNRWGQKEFEYNGNSLLFSWNGLANWGGSKELPTSDYYYIIKFNNNNFPAKTGVITLIR